jgi:hypothetical protein
MAEPEAPQGRACRAVPKEDVSPRQAAVSGEAQGGQKVYENYFFCGLKPRYWCELMLSREPLSDTRCQISNCLLRWLIEICPFLVKVANSAIIHYVCRWQVHRINHGLINKL